MPLWVSLQKGNHFSRGIFYAAIDCQTFLSEISSIYRNVRFAYHKRTLFGGFRIIEYLWAVHSFTPFTLSTPPSTAPNLKFVKWYFESLLERANWIWLIAYFDGYMEQANTNSDVLWNVETWFNSTYTNGWWCWWWWWWLWYFSSFLHGVFFSTVDFLCESLDFTCVSTSECVYLKAIWIEILLKFRIHIKLVSYKHTHTHAHIHFAFNIEHPLGYRLKASHRLKCISIIFNSKENWFVLCVYWCIRVYVSYYMKSESRSITNARLRKTCGPDSPNLMCSHHIFSLYQLSRVFGFATKFQTPSSNTHQTTQCHLTQC